MAHKTFLTSCSLKYFTNHNMAKQSQLRNTLITDEKATLFTVKSIADAIKKNTKNTITPRFSVVRDTSTTFTRRLDNTRMVRNNSIKPTSLYWCFSINSDVLSAVKA